MHYYNLVAADTIEGQIFLLLEEKLGDIAEALGKVDDQGQIAEDLRGQVLGQLSSCLKYDSLYKEALGDPSLKRTRQELEVAMSNANHAREVVFELFQDLDKFNLGDYQKYDDKGILTKLCTVNGSVPQGASTSMDIANLVCRDLDPWLRTLADSFSLKYTRYVDDITFSGKKVPERFIKKFKEIIESKKWLSLNDKKEVLKGKNQRQTVTGLNVKYDKPRVPKSYKKAVETEKHILSKFAFDGFTGEERKKAWAAIAGKENYILHVEHDA